MKLIKRMPLFGAMGYVLFIILLATSIYTFINFENKYTNLNTINESSDITIKEQATTIKTLEAQNKELNNKISELEKENEQLKEKNTKKTTTKSSYVNSKSLGKFKITAYCNCTKCCGKWAGGPTASGTMPKAGRTIAVDPKVIPLGTKVIIGGKTYVAEDTGGAIKGKRIDMYFASHTDALAWGVKYKNVNKVV